MLPGSELFELLIALLRQRFSPEQIAGKLRSQQKTRQFPSGIELGMKGMLK
ncbi:hypothetical protein PSEUDO9AZ_40179 [Pseudomonas sp. 9AZ]|nr:hypothetical protein PSEUDO9AZ_40179 [Pseudomonas sp. 9AZ]